MIRILITATLLFPLGRVQSQTSHVAPAAPLLADAWTVTGDGGDNEKDPAYKTYKEGYAFILADKWSDAMKKLAEVKAKYPKSDYLDDAAFWSAYAQKRLDRDKGVAAYEKFLEQYPGSSYADDALADMNDANVTFAVSGDAKNLKVTRAPKAFSFSYGSTMQESEKAMRDAQRAMREAQRELRRSNVYTPRPDRIFAPWGIGGREKQHDIDPKTRVKLSALRALGESENDKEAFTALKDVALDKSQPEIMRATALESLGDFRKFDVLPVLTDVAQSDAPEDVQLIAIHTISDLGIDKNKSVDVLITLFNAFPKQKEKQLQTALYAIADVGNDKAVDFLATVATTNENYELRNSAVYFLGNIGNDKSRAALLQVLKGK